MPTPTYDLIASNVLTSTATSVTFSSIPSTYRDLILVVTARITSGTGGASIRLNNEANFNYNTISMVGDGSSAQSSADSNGDAIFITPNGELGTTRTVTILQFLDYAQTNKHKSILIRANGLDTNRSVGATAARWASTSAIDTIQYRGSGATFNTDSSFYLYGIVS